MGSIGENMEENKEKILKEALGDYYITTVDQMIEGFINNMPDKEIDKTLSQLKYIMRRLHTTEATTFVMITDSNRYNPIDYNDKGRIEISEIASKIPGHSLYKCYYWPDEDTEEPFIFETIKGHSNDYFYSASEEALESFINYADEGYHLQEDLIQSDSDEAFKKNLKTELEAGKPRKQALAIAYSIKEKNRMKEDLKEGFMEDAEETLKLAKQIGIETLEDYIRLIREEGKEGETELQTLRRYRKELGKGRGKGHPWKIKEESLLKESRMADLAMEIEDAGGPDAYIGMMERELEDLEESKGWLNGQARREVGKGGAFDSEKELEDALKDTDNKIKLIKAKIEVARGNK